MNEISSKSKKIAVLGAGESGAAAARLLAYEGGRVTVFDSASPETLINRASEFGAHGIELVAGGGDLQGIADYSFAILSPGIDPAVPMVRAFADAGVPLVGELELAYSRCKCPVVAITGTNGKTTTTQLVERMFNGAGVGTLACGNIGPAFSARVTESSNLEVMTVEVSSFQLETVDAFRPKVAVWLNFAPDHLDRYRSMEEYREAKLRIFKNMGNEQWAVVNARDVLPEMPCKVIKFSAYEPCSDFELKGEVIFFRGEPVLGMHETNLRGAHNAENLMAALAVGHAWGLDWTPMREGLCSYKALPHRCEEVGVIDDVAWVNDSKATNLDALEKALNSEKRRVVLIAGGKDKGFEFGSVTDLVGARCRHAVLIGEMSSRIEKLWKDALPCSIAPSLREAVHLARTLAQAGDVVLFSPGTSSFDMFKNYADRGNQFRELIREFSSKTPGPTPH